MAEYRRGLIVGAVRELAAHGSAPDGFLVGADAALLAAFGAASLAVGRDRFASLSELGANDAS